METIVPDRCSVLDLYHQSLLDLVPMAAYAVRAPDGVIAWYNSQAAELWGRQPTIGDLDERFCGAYRLYYPDGTYMAHSQTPVAAALQSGIPVHQEDVVIERPDGSRVTVCVHIDPVRDASGKIVGVVNFFYDVTQRKRREIDIKTQAQQLELAVQERTASLSALSCRLMLTQDEERRRMSRELHDGVGQHLALAKMSVDALVRTTQDQPATRNLALEAQRSLETAITQVRTVSYLFHPPLLDECGFSSAIRTYAQEFSRRSGIEIEVHIPADLPRLSQHLETALFRIVQEGLTNVHRHSAASGARISLATDDNILRLEISDDGKGFDPNKSGALAVGLTSVRERLRELQGALEIRSTEGTRITAIVPINLRSKPLKFISQSGDLGRGQVKRGA